MRCRYVPGSEVRWRRQAERHRQQPRSRADGPRLARYDEPEAVNSLRDMAVVDANWTYSHVIVDEAQELSSMSGG